MPGEKIAGGGSDWKGVVARMWCGICLKLVRGGIVAGKDPVVGVEVRRWKEAVKRPAQTDVAMKVATDDETGLEPQARFHQN